MLLPTTVPKMLSASSSAASVTLMGVSTCATGKFSAAAADGATPVHVAAAAGHRDVAEELLKHGADPVAPRRPREGWQAAAAVAAAAAAEAAACSTK